MEIMQVPLQIREMSQGLALIEAALLNPSKTIKIFSINPEILMAAAQDAALLKILQQGNANIPDGIGVVWALKKMGYSQVQRVAGFDLFCALLSLAASQQKKVFFLGAKPHVILKAAQRVKAKYDQLPLVDFQHGYIDKQQQQELVAQLEKMELDMLFVGMGFPRQEYFIEQVAAGGKIPLLMAVGGSFDVWAAEVKRAPQWMQQRGLEWLYRTVQDRKRIKRLLVLPQFVLQIRRELVLKRKKGI